MDEGLTSKQIEDREAISRSLETSDPKEKTTHALDEDDTRDAKRLRITPKKIQEIVAIMDRSGSMMGKVADSVGGFNSAIEAIRSDQDDDFNINVSLKLFDHEEKLLFNRIPLSEVKPLEEGQLIPRGQTALLDAIGHTLMHFMEKKLKDPQSYDCCTVYVVTDGRENCSKNFTRTRIKELIKTAEEKYNIKLIYLAANQDAILEAGHIGIDAGQAINYSESNEETRAAHKSAAAMVGRHRSGEPVKFSEYERQASCKPTKM